MKTPTKTIAAVQQPVIGKPKEAGPILGPMASSEKPTGK